MAHTPDPSGLVTVEDMQEINHHVDYEEILSIFAKYKVSLAEIDKQIIAKEGRGLVFNGFYSKASQLRLLISMGCDIQTGETDPLYGSYPFIYEARFLYREEVVKSHELKKNILEKMAILFFHGSPLQAKKITQPHPLKCLSDEDFDIFLDHLDKEITAKFGKCEDLIEQAPLSCHILKL